MSTERESLIAAQGFPDADDRTLVWETLRTHQDHRVAEYALQALDRIFDRLDEDDDPNEGLADDFANDIIRESRLG